MGRLEIACRNCGTVHVPGHLVRFAYVELGAELQVDAQCGGCGRWAHVFAAPGLRDRLELIGARPGPAAATSRFTEADVRELVEQLEDERFVELLAAG